MRQTEILLAISGQRRVEVRLQHLLLLLKREVGEPVPEGIRIGMRLTHQDLANAIGTTRVTITRLLSKFKHELMGGSPALYPIGSASGRIARQ
nr:helix-turn-helix domain-containing protein [Moorena bouillonii]